MNHEAGVFCGLIVTVRASYLLVEKSILILFLSFFIVSFLPKRQSSQNMISQPRPSKRQYRDTFSLIKIHLYQQSTINQNSKICINQSINQFIVQSIYLSISTPLQSTQNSEPRTSRTYTRTWKITFNKSHVAFNSKETKTYQKSIHCHV